MENQLYYGTNKDAHQFITYMLEKSKRFEDFLLLNNIEDSNKFAEKHLYNNPPIVNVVNNEESNLKVDFR